MAATFPVAFAVAIVVAFVVTFTMEFTGVAKPFQRPPLRLPLPGAAARLPPKLWRFDYGYSYDFGCIYGSG